MKTTLSAITITIAGFWTLAAVQTQAQESSPAAATKTETAATAAQRTDTEWDGVSVELTSITRGEGDTITIKFRYTNSGSKTADITDLGQFVGRNVAEQVYYIDPGNKKKYLVIKDAEGKAILFPVRSARLMPLDVRRIESE